jgi:hypothetical protein
MRVKLFLALMAGLAILVAGIDSFAVKGASTDGESVGAGEVDSVIEYGGQGLPG